MTIEEAFDKTVEEFLPQDIIIKSAEDADALHEKFIELRTTLFMRQIIEVMPHYRGEQKFGWDIEAGLFRAPLNTLDTQAGKELEKKAIQEFNRVIEEEVGAKALRDLFNNEPYGKEWDLLFQAQHAGIKTTLTDWSAFIISALYFATEESTNPEIETADAQLWIFIVPDESLYGHSTHAPRKTYYDLNPHDLKETILINPPSYLDSIEERLYEFRMYRQKGRFIMPSNNTCNIPLNKQKSLKKYIFKARIPGEFKAVIRKELSDRGIDRVRLYVDEAPSGQSLITGINNKIFNQNPS